MKTIKFLLLTALFTMNLSCDSDDNNVPPPALPPAGVNGVEIGATIYNTSNAYLILNDVTNDYERDFTFIFSNGTVIEDGSFDVAYDNNTTHFVKITADLIATVTNQADLPIFQWTTTLPLKVLIEGENYAHAAITGFNNTVSQGALTYGQPTGAMVYNHADLTLVDPAHGPVEHVIDITAFTYDLLTNTGTISCTYTWEDDNGTLIEGRYDGNFDILTGF